MIDDNSDLHLRLLNVKQLKKISSEMSTRTIIFHNNNLSTPIQNPIFFPPKSGARKAEWISAIAIFFQEHASNNNIYNILNGTTTASASASTIRSSPARTSAKRPSPGRGAKKSPVARKSPFKASNSAKKPSPAKAIKKSPVRKSPPKAKASRMTKMSPAKSSANAAMAADAAIARSFQNRYMQEDILMGHFMTQTNPPLGSNGHQAWGGPLANSHLQNCVGNTANASYGNARGIESAAGLKRPASYNDSTKPKCLPAKVKKEPPSYSTTSHATHSHTHASAATSSATTDEDSLRPRDFRESNMCQSLREMGFTDTQEILTALRAVAAQREEISIVSAATGMDTGWSTQEQVEAAMMWIVSQREEAAEAQKLDEARISSEQADAAMEQSRRQEMERDLKNADLVDLIGSPEGDDSVEIKSKHFPFSVLLGNRSVRTVLRVIASGASPAKEEVIRLLSLEKKARKWYGTVLPFSYFEYVLCPRFEGWAKELVKNLSHECDELQKSMFNLSEQEEGGVGSVPKVFLAAQRDATEKGRPISCVDSRTRNDHDVEVLQLPVFSKSGKVGKSLPSTGSASGSNDPYIEVIDIT